jgi:hypothetical protein
MFSQVKNNYFDPEDFLASDESRRYSDIALIKLISVLVEIFFPSLISETIGYI